MGKRKPIESPDLTNESKTYWEAVLSSYGLGMSAGGPSRRIVSNIGGLTNIVGLEEEELRKATGRVEPEGKGPDK